MMMGWVLLDEMCPATQRGAPLASAAAQPACARILLYCTPRAYTDDMAEASTAGRAAGLESDAAFCPVQHGFSAAARAPQAHY